MSDYNQPLPKGSRIEGEYAEETDPHTGARVCRITGGGGTNHALFFLVSSFRPGHPDEMAFVTHRSGHPQICLFDFRSRSARVLTDRPGLHAFSPAFTPDGALLLYTTRKSKVCSVGVNDGKEQEHLTLEGAGLGECAPSTDGARVVIPFKRAGQHGLVVLDLRDGGHSVVLEREMKIIHPQFHPRDSGKILFAGDPYPRLWMVDTQDGEPRCLYENGSDAFIVHESFRGRSDELIFAVWPRRLARMDVNEGRIRTVAEVNAWHMASDPSGEWIISDTAHPDRGLVLIDPRTGGHVVVCHPGASCQGTQWEKDHPAGPEVWEALRGEAGENLSWMEMKADHVYGPQTTHPHPAFDREGRRVSFTSDRSGSPQVYVVDTAPFQSPLCVRA